MAILHSYPFCPQSRFARLVLAELGVEPSVVEEKPWERRLPFLEINPGGNLPLFIDDDGLAVPGALIIAEYMDDTRGDTLRDRRFLPRDIAERVEVRRLLDWFLVKFHAEVSDYLATEKIYKRFMPTELGGGSPDMGAIRAARTNVRYHLKYIGYLIATRNWLAGDRMTYADLAAAAHLSVVDYLGDVPWDENETAKHWYARIKSRPSFRALLAERVPGMAPAEHYDNLDF
ncbi:glutathione S-transferase family protein [Microvirga aerophila]|jgi:glutathione S-transferase|uniref:Glutathione S-transferase n=1 Tax=Microvirga aerophila TaxID=670291 RepID=A0A512BPL6_9HYPH|nr:glutathione S-transferase family protein [Microvirga aerophila]GEO13908.1 glutathione S-transferase [Microvirga aerophila]